MGVLVGLLTEAARRRTGRPDADAMILPTLPARGRDLRAGRTAGEAPCGRGRTARCSPTPDPTRPPHTLTPHSHTPHTQTPQAHHHTPTPHAHTAHTHTPQAHHHTHSPHTHHTLTTHAHPTRSPHTPACTHTPPCGVWVYPPPVTPALPVSLWPRPDCPALSGAFRQRRLGERLQNTDDGRATFLGIGRLPA